MKRSTIDKVISSMGVLLAVALLAGAGGLYFTYTFIHDQVSTQLSSQKISFPEKDSTSFTSLPDADRKVVEPYAGQQVTTGAQAAVFANNYIAVHINKIGGGKTYSELSEASLANPSDTALASKVNTVFKGETLRGILLNAYAFDTMAIVAKFAAIGATIAGVVLLVLSFLGFQHAKVAAKTPARKAAKKR